MIPSQATTEKHSALTLARRACLKALAEYYCVNVTQAGQLLNTTSRNIQRHFKTLVEGQFVYARAYESETYRRGALPLAYGLTDSGVSLAFREGWETDATKSFKGHALRTIEHELMITEFHLKLVKLCEERSWALRWRQRRLDKNKVRPDALFAINDEYFFLEMERAKLGDYQDGNPSIVRKIHSYREYLNSSDCREDFGFTKFRVVTVMRTPERAANLRNRIKGVADEGFAFVMNESTWICDVAEATIRGALPTKTLCVPCVPCVF
jgi:hypothetical protein